MSKLDPKYTLMLMQWGQFVDHDIDLTEGVDPPEPADIPVPVGDPFFDPSGTGADLEVCQHVMELVIDRVDYGLRDVLYRYYRPASTFSGKVFTACPGVTEERSQKIVEANMDIIEMIEAGSEDTESIFKLRKGFYPNKAINLPAEVLADIRRDLLEVLRECHSPAILSTLLPGKLRTTPEIFAGIV